VLGCCENDKDTAEVLETLYPDVPNHGDLRDVISALEVGELVLKPDMVEISIPCQGRSVARRLTEWADELHPHHNLWRLQAKLVKLTQPKVVLIENVPWRDTGAHPTKHQYVKLRQELEELGYHVEERNDVNCASHGDHTARVRYFAVATRHDMAAWRSSSFLRRGQSTPDCRRFWSRTIACAGRFAAKQARGAHGLKAKDRGGDRVPVGVPVCSK
jgi:site-specific DNA-cytosine methylase